MTTTITTCLTLRHPPAEGKISYQDASTTMQTILSRHNEQDNLSNQLREWGTRLVNSNVMSALDQNPEETDEIERQFCALASQRILELFNKICVYPLDPRISLGDKPVFDGEWTWPREELTRYYNLTGTTRSPYTGQLIIEQEHLFFLEISAFAQTLIKKVNPADESSSSSSSNAVPVEEFNQLALSETSQALAPPLEYKPASDMERNFHILSYIQLADAAKEMARLRADARKHNEEKVKTLALISQIEEEHEQLLIKSEALLAQHENLIKNNIDSADSAHQAEISAVKEQLNQIVEERKALSKRLDAANDTITAYGTRIAVQDMQIQSLQASVTALQNRKHKRAIIPIYW